jgi:CheY-like chemotaxis protein
MPIAREISESGEGSSSDSVCQPKKTSMEFPLHILMVEDHPDHRIILQHYLRKLGPVVVLEAPDGQQAVELVARGDPIDLIIMDLDVPVLDGWEATRRIRALPSPLNRIPILAFSAYARPREIQRALAAGCNDYLTKPLLDVTLLQQKIAQLLAQGPTP